MDGSVLGDDLERRVDEARAARDTVGGVVEVCARGVPPGLGSYATKGERLDVLRMANLERQRGAARGAGTRGPAADMRAKRARRRGQDRKPRQD